jgi:hypothetical protein
VQTMPCVHARQSLCRAYRPLCRPMARTAKPVSPVVHVSISGLFWVDRMGILQEF